MKVIVSMGIALILLCFVFWPVFFVDYAFTDEAFQLWYNDTGIDFTIFSSQGRFLTGYIVETLFNTFTSISELKWIRAISLAGWAVTTVAWTIVLNKWKLILNLNERYVRFLQFFLPCSIPVAIAVGWGSCVELFLAFVTALLSGHLLFVEVEQKKYFSLKIVGSVLLAYCSLFLYQPMFGAFLLPFFMHHIYHKYQKINRVLFIGVGAYLALSLLYFAVLKSSINMFGVEPGDRVVLTIQPLKKLSFFLSQPLPQAFSFNFLYNMSGIFSQAFFPAMLVVWLVSVFGFDKDKPVVGKLGYIVNVLLLMLLMYVSILVSRDNFASYRTMLPLNLAGTILLMDAILKLVRKDALHKWISYTACAIVAAVASFNFYLNYSRPLGREYQAIQAQFKQGYKTSITKICFIRPPESLFTQRYGVHVFKDEFGMPSTFKDWTPEPLVRQLVLEATGSKEKAKQVAVVHIAYEERESLKPEAGCLVIDVAAMLK